jgi:hypothetical protein
MVFVNTSNINNYIKCTNNKELVFSTELIYIHYHGVQEYTGNDFFIYVTNNPIMVPSLLFNKKLYKNPNM